MGKMLIFEFKNCIKKKSCKVIFSFLFFISISGYLVTCYEFYGDHLTFIRSAHEVCIIQGVYSRFLKNIEVLLLPLICCIIYSDSYYIEYKSGVYKSILTRTDRKNYIVSKAIVIFTIVFISFFLTLFLNQVLCLIAFPTEGFDNNYALPAYDIGFQNFAQGKLFDLIRLQHPFLYNSLFIVIISIFASVFALLGYSISLVYKKNRLLAVGIVYIAYIVSEVCLPLIGMEDFAISNYLSASSYTSSLILGLVLLIMFSISIFIIFIGINRPEI
ncbi:hypothetical protein [Clostridium sp.]|uniref:hypothetical protein n=1 Tax=Clostridium sp. TaxID=1506 RepID=UPI0028437B29|nr:hypothetical protein [Clostridium sp.]MDR3595875.1 hypothetical protein [Clostridium sp.]